MTEWNARLVTPDGEEIEPSDKFKGTHRSSRRRQSSVSSDVHAYDLEPQPEPHRRVETLRCPECRTEYADRGGEADCLRSHIRKRADQLQQLADEGHEVLEVAT